MEEVIASLITRAEELLSKGKELDALEVAVSAYAYRESGVLMPPAEALGYLKSRFPGEELVSRAETIIKRSEEEGDIRGTVEILLAILRDDDFAEF